MMVRLPTHVLGFNELIASAVKPYGKSLVFIGCLVGITFYPCHCVRYQPMVLLLNELGGSPSYLGGTAVLVTTIVNWRSMNFAAVWGYLSNPTYPGVNTFRPYLFSLAGLSTIAYLVNWPTTKPTEKITMLNFVMNIIKLISFLRYHEKWHSLRQILLLNLFWYPAITK